jgi:hypothetical protein
MPSIRHRLFGEHGKRDGLTLMLGAMTGGRIESFCLE